MQPSESGQADLAQLVRSFPWLTFWYGIGLQDLVHYPRWALNAYIEELPELINHYQMTLITAATFPYMTAEGQQTILDLVRSRAKPEALPPQPEETQERVSREEYMGALAMHGIVFSEPEQPVEQPPGQWWLVPPAEAQGPFVEPAWWGPTEELKRKIRE